MQKNNKVKILIIKKIDSIGSFDTSKYKVGKTYEVGFKLAEVLIKEGFAEKVKGS